MPMNKLLDWGFIMNSIYCLLFIFFYFLIFTPVQAGGEKKNKKSSKRSIEQVARVKGGSKREIRKNIIKQVKKYIDVEFNKTRSANDHLHGFVTYSIADGGTDKNDRQFAAYIFLNWGDLYEKIPNISSKYYSNWDGCVKIREAGYASVVQEFAFDDRKNREPKVGTGIDKLLKDSTSSQVRWRSAVVGATDGLLIKLALHKQEAKGEIQIGPYNIPFIIRSKNISDVDK